MLPPFELLRPDTLDEALEMLGTDPTPTPIAGGTNVLVDLRGRVASVGVLMDVGRLTALRRIERMDSALEIGAGTTIAELLDNPLVANHAPILTTAYRQFAAPLIRNRATMGGNLAHASPAADSAPPLLVLDASLVLRSASRERVVPIEEFFVGPCCTTRREDELIVAVRIPNEMVGASFAYEKVRLRNADAISVVSVAALRERESGRLRLALGAVAPTPIRVREVEDALSNVGSSNREIEEAAARAAKASQPIGDVRSSADYRRRAVDVLVRRCLNSLKEGP